MSVYNARRAPNVSQYIDELNQVPTSFDLPQQPVGEEFDFEGSLAMFTNAEFPDFDAGDVGTDSIPFDPALDDVDQNTKNDPTTSGNDGMSGFPVFDTDLNIPTFSEYPQQFQNPLMQSGVPQGYHNGASSIQSPTTSSPLSHSSPVNQFPHGTKRKAESATLSTPQSGAQSLEEQSRLAAEEDKRRRNTAASARFRVKKKEREKALERNVKEISDKNVKLEQRMSQLEMENRWLRQLITEKNGSKNDVDITQMWQKFRRESEERERAGKEQKEGVGTGAELKTES